VQQYGVREVEKLLQLPRSTIRALVAAGFVSPGRGPRNAWRFSFQDLIALRTAQALVAAKVPPRRILRSLRALRRRLPQSMPLSGLSVAAVADRVIVKEGASRWQAESGQYLLGFEGDPAAGSLSILQGKPRTQWFEEGAALENSDSAGAIDDIEFVEGPVDGYDNMRAVFAASDIFVPLQAGFPDIGDPAE